MKIALAQLNYHIGNFEANEAKIVNAIKEAKAKQAELVVFAELSICGYPPRDFLQFEDFIAQCEKSIERIAQHCNGIAAILGAPSKNPNAKGKKLYNSAYFITEQKVQSIHHKQLLPTYDIFDEYRYFEPASEVNCISYKGKNIALTICEDLWNVEGEYLYQKVPMQELKKQGADFMINIAASPFHKEQAAKRDQIFSLNTQKFDLPLYYVNHIGAQTELIFDGGTAHYNKSGDKCAVLSSFEEGILFVQTESETEKPKPETQIPTIEKIEKALILGVEDYFKKLNFKSATLGLSGGIDSALTLAIAVKALGPERVIPIMMPSQFSSDHSISDSVALCENLGCDYHEIAIKPIYDAFEEQLHPLFKNTEFNVAEENIQSRIRGSLVMAHTNKFGTILLNTSNKSELAVGYGTLYGDMAGGLSVIGDLYKTEVYELSKFLNRKEEIIPKNILTKEPSAELRPNQKDSDSLPDYEILDQILYDYIENELSPQQIIDKGHDKNLIAKVLRLVNLNEYKRHQAPPILRVSKKAFGMGRRMPIVGKYLI